MVKKMDAIEAILTRRSIRKYLKKPITNKILNELIKVGMNAPSAGNEKPWHFIILDDKSILKKIADKLSHAKMCYDAPLAIVACIDLDLAHTNFFPQDLSAATENILIAARGLGLGAVWVGVFPVEERMAYIKELLDLPENIIPFNIIPIGYTEVLQEMLPERYKVERIHYNRW